MKWNSGNLPFFPLEVPKIPSAAQQLTIGVDGSFTGRSHLNGYPASRRKS